jgi:hypothetical protein
MMSRLTQRERYLLAGVALLLFVLGNAFLLSWMTARNAAIQSDLRAKRSQIESMKSILAESDRWAARAAWVDSHQPKLNHPDQAGVLLLNEVKEVARANDVLLESPELGGVEMQPGCRSVSVQVATKSSWPGLIKFMHALQQPDRFIVFESANLRIDPGNPARMACRFKIAKWYAL